MFKQIFSWIKHLFAEEEERESQAERIAEQVNSILEFNPQELADNQSFLEACLDLMSEELTHVQNNANGYPNGSISAYDWFSGSSLAISAENLAEYLSDLGMLNHQAKATHVWTGATLAVCAHYHHLVGPAMIANAKVNEQLGDLECAQKAYRAVIADFECMLEYFEEEDLQPEGEELIAIESLEQAIESLLKIDAKANQEAELMSLKQRVERVLAVTEK